MLMKWSILFLLLPFAASAQWSVVNHGFNQNWRCIDFPNSMTGYIGGTAGKILKTTDGGSTWNQLSAPFSEPVAKVKFVNDSLGLIINDGNKVARTTDGGNSWNTITHPHSQGSFTNVEIIHADTFFLVGEDYVNTGDYGVSGLFHGTFDGGQTWTSKKWQGSTTYDPWDPWSATAVDQFVFRDVEFVNGTTGFICGYDLQGQGPPPPTLRKTTDGGKSWKVINISPYSGSNWEFIDIEFITDQIGFVTSMADDVFKTTNGGQSWTNISSIQDIYFAAADFPTSSIGYFIAREIGQKSGAYLTAKPFAGISFHSYCPSTAILTDLAFASPTIGFFIGDGSIIYKLDASIVRVEEGLQTNEIVVFPNPASDHIKVQWSSMKNRQVEFSLIDPTGSIKQSGKVVLDGTGSSEFNVQCYSTGIYLLHIRQGNSASTHKIQIAR